MRASRAVVVSRGFGHKRDYKPLARFWHHLPSAKGIIVPLFSGIECGEFDRKSRLLLSFMEFGDVAQLGERMNGIHGVCCG